MKWNPKSYAENARYVSDLGMPVVDLLSPKSGERILDLGCGDGTLMKELLQFGCEVVGVDSSPEFIEAAKSRGLTVHLMDGHTLSFDCEFDAVFSNAALHWMKTPEKVLAGVWTALKPEGRFVGEFGGYGNVASIVEAIESAIVLRKLKVENPWYFPKLEEYQALLQSKGFVVKSITSTPRPTFLPGDVSGWLRTFAQPYISVISQAEREEFITEVTNELREKLADENGNWIADYVRIRFFATKSNQVN